MKRIAIYLASILILITSLVSCVIESSDSVAQDRIFTSYTLFYNENLDKTFAQATFRFSNALGTKLELVSPSSVKFNDDELTFNDILGFYEKIYSGFVESGTFQFTDTEDNIYTNSISLPPVHYPVELDSINASESFDLIWGGTPLESKDKVTVTITGNLELDTRIFIVEEVNATSIILGKDKLSEIGKGEITMWMDREKNEELRESTDAGGAIKGIYRAKNAMAILY